MIRNLLRIALPWSLAVAPALASAESFETPFFLNFGMSVGDEGGENLLMTPSGHPFSLQWDNLNMTAGHASAMAEVTNLQPGGRFTLRGQLRPEQFVPGKPDDRVGFAVLGGPHEPPANGFDTTDGEFYGLTWSPAIDGTTSVIEIREGFTGSLLGQEVWQGKHPRATDHWEGMYEIYQLQADGVYDGSGALKLTFTLTDPQGHAQSVSATIAEPRAGNLFGIGGSLSSDMSGQPQFAFLNLSVSDHVILSETFRDGERLVQNLPHTSAWWGSQAASLSQPADGIISSVTGQTLITYFTDSGLVSLAVGEELQVSLDFQVANASPAATHSGIRIGLMNSSTGLGRVAGDGFGSSNGSFQGYTGYGGWIHPQGADTRFRERVDMEHTGLLNNNNTWTNRRRNTADATHILSDTTYTGMFRILRTADGVTGSYTISGPNFEAVTVSYEDVGSSLFEFDTLGVWTNSNSGDTFSLTRIEIAVVTVEAPAGSTFAAWQGEHFPGETDPDIIGPGANPAGDGISNLLKYAFGLNPLTPAAWADVIEAEAVAGALRLSYLARVDAEDIEYVPELSLNLIDWESGPAHVEEVETEVLPGGEFSRVTVRALLEGDPQKAFLRVDVRQK